MMSKSELLDQVLSGLKSDDPEVREKAVEEYALRFFNRPDPRAVELLIEMMLSDGVARVRAKAVRALGIADDPRIVESLLKALEDEAAEVRVNAARSLSQASHGLVRERIIDPLLKALEDGEAKVRAYAARSLRLTGYKPEHGRIIVPLLRTLEDGDAGVRFCAARALGVIRDQRVIPAMIKALGDENTGVRSKAYANLVHYHDTSTGITDDLVDYLEQNSAEMNDRSFSKALVLLERFKPTVGQITELKPLLMSAILGSTEMAAKGAARTLLQEIEKL